MIECLEVDLTYVDIMLPRIHTVVLVYTLAVSTTLSNLKAPILYVQLRIIRRNTLIQYHYAI